VKKRLSIVLAVVLTVTLLLTSATFAWTVVEDFEWGNDGDSLATDGGDVDWTVYTSGGAVAEIDTAQKHTGTRSALLCRGSGGFAYAYYQLRHPSYIGFWVRKDKTAYASIYNGDGAYAINFCINWAENVRYYDGSYHTVYKISPNTWYHIELKNINWGAHTYDIYVNGICRKTGAQMSRGIFYCNYVYFAHRFCSGKFWIDDITDSEH